MPLFFSLKRSVKQFNILLFLFHMSITFVMLPYNVQHAIVYRYIVFRLSKIAEENFTADNSNIADLYDENRPTKLSDRFSELYDNEWTDAFEQVFEEMDEISGIKYLLGVLQVKY